MTDNHNLPSHLPSPGEQEQPQIVEPVAGPEQLPPDFVEPLTCFIELPEGLLAHLDDPTKLTPKVLRELGRAIYDKCSNAAKAMEILARRDWDYAVYDDDAFSVPYVIDLSQWEPFDTIVEAEAALKSYGVPPDTVKVIDDRGW
jgi:hypothetical protein